MKKLLKAILHPKMAWNYLQNKRLEGAYGKKLSDEAYLKKAFKLRMGKKLDLDNPKTFSEKLQWLKLYDRKPEYTVMVDKYLVRKYIAEKLGEEYLIPLLGVWDSPEEIDFEALPEQFVLKCNHNSGAGMYICTDKSKMDVEKVKAELRKGLAQDYYLHGREWPYKNVPRKIVAEKYMVDESGYELKDYKFFCFDGEVKALFIAKDRTKEDEETKFDFFDADFNHLPFTNGHPNAEPPYFKPDKFEEMKELAKVLSAGIPQLRVDFYNINGKIYFWELTFSHWSGMVPFSPEEWDYKFGEWIKLPEKTENDRG